MKTNLLILLMVLAIISCSKSNEMNNSEKNYENVDLMYQIFIKNSKGENLLNPDVDGSYKVSEVKLFRDAQLSDIVIDTFIELDDKYGYFLNLYGGGGNLKKENDNTFNYGTLYLQLNSTTIDTIYSQSIYGENSILLHKVIYNSEVVFNNTWDDRTITIIKE